MPPVVRKETICGLETVTLENELVRAVILVGKGADLLEFIWKPLGINCFYRSDTPWESFQELDLSRQRLKHHSDHTLGGWMEALPHRGIYKNIELTQENGGLTATLPWNGEAVVEDGRAVVRCDVELPIFPLRVEKVFTLREGSATLEIDETVIHQGDAEMRFTWTQHALFGQGFINENTVVCVPSPTVFKAWEHMENPDAPLEAYEDPVSMARLRQGVFDLRHPLPPGCSGYEFVVYHPMEKGEAKLVNQDVGLALHLCWDIGQFPYLRSLYQNGASGPVVGLEPGDDLFSGFAHSIHHKTFTTMNPGETIKTGFTLGYVNCGRGGSSEHHGN